jgi:tetratricopeptide (TPR) repeat protein
MRTLDADLNNIRAVLSRRGWTQEVPQEQREARDLPLRLAGALWWFWVVRGHWSEGLRFLQDLLSDNAREGAPSLTVARALYTAGTLAWTLNLYEECTVYCQQSLDACRVLHDRWGSGFSLALLGTIAARQGNYRKARSLLEESLSGFREIEDRWGTAFALDHLAHACRDEQAYQQATEFYAESLSLRKGLGDQQGMAMSLSNLADTAQLQGHWERAVVLHETSLERFRELGDRAGIAYCVGRLADCALQGDDAIRATTLNMESLRMFHELGDKRRIAESLEKIADLRRTEGRSEAAVRLLGAASALRTERHMPLPSSERRRVETSAAILRTTLGTPAFDSAWIQGQTMNIEEAVLYAFHQG